MTQDLTVKEQLDLIDRWFNIYFAPYFCKTCVFRKSIKLAPISIRELSILWYIMMSHIDESLNNTTISENVIENVFSQYFNIQLNQVYLPEELTNYLKTWKQFTEDE